MFSGDGRQSTQIDNDKLTVRVLNVLIIIIFGCDEKSQGRIITQEPHRFFFSIQLVTVNF